MVSMCIWLRGCHMVCVYCHMVCVFVRPHGVCLSMATWCVFEYGHMVYVVIWCVYGHMVWLCGHMVCVWSHDV